MYDTQKSPHQWYHLTAARSPRTGPRQRATPSADDLLRPNQSSKLELKSAKARSTTALCAARCRLAANGCPDWRPMVTLFVADCGDTEALPWRPKLASGDT